MSVEIVVPPLGESIVEATISRLLKHEGDTVAAGEPVAELETDKVNMEVTSEHAGVLEKIRFKEGDTIAVNDVLALLSESGNGAAPKPVDAPKVEPAQAQLASPAPPAAENSADNGAAKATPLAVKIAQENGIDLRTLVGTGAGGKIVQEDVEAAISSKAQPAPALPPLRPAAPAVEVAPPARPAVSTPTVAATAAPVSANANPRETRIRMTKRRQVIAERLKEAQETAAMLTTFNEVDMTAVMELRKRRRDAFKERHGVNLGFMSFFTKAVIGALKAFPYLNAEIQGNEIVLKKYYDIGIAVGVDEGLVVPVVRDADTKTFAGIEKEILDLATRARDNKLSISELMGGTFTITNGGVFGSLMSTPILNYPQVGILGMHKIQERVMVVGGEMVVRPMMYLALSYDHRIVDGGDAVRFLVRIKELLEDPETLLLEG